MQPELMITALPCSPPVRFYNWGKKKKTNKTNNPKTRRKRLKGICLTCMVTLKFLTRGVFMFHIRELLMSFGKWNDTKGLSLLTQISINQCSEEDG